MRLTLQLTLRFTFATLAFRVGMTGSRSRFHTPFSANSGHMGAIPADDLPAFSAGFPCFVAGKFVRGALAVGGSATLGGDLALFFPTH